MSCLYDRYLESLAAWKAEGRPPQEIDELSVAFFHDALSGMIQSQPEPTDQFHPEPPDPAK